MSGDEQTGNREPDRRMESQNGLGRAGPWSAIGSKRRRDIVTGHSRRLVASASDIEESVSR
jgi:hypothetical protein